MKKENEKCIFQLFPDMGSVIVTSIISVSLSFVAFFNRINLLILSLLLILVTTVIFIAKLRKIYVYENYINVIPLLNSKKIIRLSFNEIQNVSFYFPTFRGTRTMIIRYKWNEMFFENKFYTGANIPVKEFSFFKSKGVQLRVFPKERINEVLY